WPVDRHRPAPGPADSRETPPADRPVATRYAAARPPPRIYALANPAPERQTGSFPPPSGRHTETAATRPPQASRDETAGYPRPCATGWLAPTPSSGIPPASAVC